MMYHYYMTYKDLLLLLKYKANFPETEPKSLLWDPTCEPGFEYVPWLAC